MVIALLGLLSALILPDFIDILAKYKVEVTARELAQNIRLAQQKAISEGILHKIVFNLDQKDSYQMLYGSRGKMVKFPSGVFIYWTTYANIDKTLSFSPSGAPNRGGTIAIRSGKKTLYVIVSIATGRVRVGEAPP